MPTAYPSSPPKSVKGVDVETLAAVLRDGSSHDAGKAGVAGALDRLRELGLISVQDAQYVLCVNHKDPDYHRTVNRACSGRIKVDDALDEEGNDFECPECGRVVYPGRKARQRVTVVSVLLDGVASHIEGLLGETGLTWKSVGDWVWRVDTPKGEVKLVVADYCQLDHLSREWAARNHVCYIVVDAVNCRKRFLPEKWLAWRRLADMVSDKSALSALLDSAASAAPAQMATAAVPVYSATVRPIMKGSGPENSMQRIGRTWQVTFGGETRPVKDTKGLSHIAHLIANQGKDIHCVDLLARFAGDGKKRAAGTAGAVLDEKAKADYLRRLKEIDAELEEAASDNDLGRQETLQMEKESFRSEICKAVGLGGRRRRAADDREKTRQAVSKSVNRALDILDTEHPPLARHLRSGVLHIGEVLSYRPETAVPWRI